MISEYRDRAFLLREWERDGLRSAVVGLATIIFLHGPAEHRTCRDWCHAKRVASGHIGTLQRELRLF